MRLRPGYHELHYFGEKDAIKAIIEAAPACYAVHVALNFRLRQQIELFPGESDRIFNEAIDAEIPSA